MFGILVLFGIIAIAIALASTPFVTRDTAFVVVRIFLTVLVFVLSSDVLGAFQAHLSAANDIKGPASPHDGGSRGLSPARRAVRHDGL